MNKSVRKNIPKGEGKWLALCVSRFFRDEQREHIQTFCRCARDYGCRVFVFSTLTDLYFDDINDFGEKQIYSMMDIKDFDAVIIMSETFKKVSVDREIADLAIQNGVPVISVNRKLDGCVNVDFSYRESFEKIVRHIVEDHRCRKVNYIGGDLVSRFSRERFDVYRRVLEENGIPLEEKRIGYGDFRASQALEVLDKFLEEGELPQAIICANDTMAIAVCGKLKKAGIRIPEDIKVTGFDGMDFEKYCDPRLTTAVYDCERTVRCVLETAVAISEGEKTPELITVPYEFQVGHSCGCRSNQVFPALEQLFEYQNMQNDTEEYYQGMMNMSSKANNCEDFSEIMRLIRSYSAPIRYKEYWICLKKELWEKIDQKAPFEEEIEKNAERSRDLKEYTNEVKIVSHSRLSKEALQGDEPMMFLPIHLQGLFVGYLAVAFLEEEMRYSLLNTFMMSLRNIIESYWNRMAQEQLLCKDELTNLYNTRGYQKKMRSLFEKKEILPYLTMMTLDVDDMKMINESYGHEEGNDILCRIGRMITELAEPEEICARLNSDEFVIVNLSQAGRARAQALQDNIERKLADYNLMSGKTYELRLSIGYYTGVDVDRLDYEVISGQADKERYLDKQSHKKSEIQK